MFISHHLPHKLNVVEGETIERLHYLNISKGTNTIELQPSTKMFFKEQPSFLDKLWQFDGGQPGTLKERTRVWVSKLFHKYLTSVDGDQWYEHSLATLLAYLI